MSAHIFGHIDGAPVMEVEIASKAGARAKILSWGAVLRDLVVPTASGPQRVTLGLNSIEDYVAHSPSFGAVPGPLRQPDRQRALHARRRRPSNSRASPAKSIRCTAARRVSASASGSSASTANSFVTLTLESPDGEAGFPGNLTADLRLQDARAGDLARRTDGDLRPADRRQPDAARLFQSRRVGRRARPRTGAGLRFLYADATRN